MKKYLFALFASLLAFGTFISCDNGLIGRNSERTKIVIDFGSRQGARYVKSDSKYFKAQLFSVGKNPGKKETDLELGNIPVKEASGSGRLEFSEVEPGTYYIRVFGYKDSRMTEQTAEGSSADYTRGDADDGFFSVSQGETKNVIIYMRPDPNSLESKGAYTKLDQTHISFGIMPQTLKDDSVTVYLDRIKEYCGQFYYAGNDGEWYFYDSENYYKAEPILWTAVDCPDEFDVTINGMYIADSILDAVSYVNADAENVISYDDSNLRSYLNGKFLPSAFNETQMNDLLYASLISHDFEFSDRVFVLDAEKLRAISNSKMKTSTDYAKREYDVGSAWWTRSDNNDNDVFVVNKVDADKAEVMESEKVDQNMDLPNRIMGVVPAIYLDFTDQYGASNHIQNLSMFVLNKEKEYVQISTDKEESDNPFNASFVEDNKYDLYIECTPENAIDFILNEVTTDNDKVSVLRTGSNSYSIIIPSGSGEFTLTVKTANGVTATAACEYKLRSGPDLNTLGNLRALYNDEISYGIWPQSKKADGVDIFDDSRSTLFQGKKYWLGSDYEWYEKYE